MTAPVICKPFYEPNLNAHPGIDGMNPCRNCGRQFSDHIPRPDNSLACKTAEGAPLVSPANAEQVGGEHYKKLEIQPWDYILRNGIPYMEGCAIKYLTRWRDKGGVEDLKKAKHFIEKLIEYEEGRRV